DDAREDILDQIAKTNPNLGFAATWRSSATTKRSGIRVLNLIRSQKVDPNFYRMLIYGGWLASLDWTIGANVLQELLNSNAEMAIEPVLANVEHITRTHPEFLGQYSDLVWAAVEGTPATVSSHVEWEWTELAQRLASTDPVRVATLILRRAREDNSPHL